MSARDVQIMARQLDVMQQQHAQMIRELALKEALNQQLIAEYAELKAQYDLLQQKGEQP